MYPRADGREESVESVATGMELQLSAVVDVVRPHRANDRQVIDATAHMRPPVANFDAALAAPAVADLQWVKFGENLSHIRRGSPNIVIQELFIQNTFVRRFGDRDAG